MTNTTTSTHLRVQPHTADSEGMSSAIRIGGGLLICVLAVSAGLAVGEGSKAAVVLPLVTGVALIVVGLALTRFRGYVLLMLVARASIDLARVSGPSDGATESIASRLLNPSSLFGLLFLVVAVVWLLTLLRDGAPLTGTSLRPALVLFLAIGLSSAIGAEHPVTSALELTRLASAVAAFLVLEQLTAKPRDVRIILGAAFGSAVLPLVVTLTGALSGAPRVEEQGEFVRVMGPFTTSNELGRYLMFLVIMGIALHPYLSRTLKRAMTAFLAASGLALLLTLTLSAIIGVAVGLAIVGILQSKRILIALVTAGGLSLVLIPSLSERVQSVLPADSTESTAGNSLAWRFQYWGEVAQLAEDSPVTGIGLGQTPHNTDARKQPHNDFLRAYVEMGVVGLVTYLGVLGALILLGRRAVRVSAPRTLERGVAVGFLGCAASFVLVSTVANVLSNTPVLWYFFAFAAAAVAVARGGGVAEPNDQPLEASR
ncbi:MAG: O-antigen ligase family protein [Acidimicrobiales bacterium]